MTMLSVKLIYRDCFITVRSEHGDVYSITVQGVTGSNEQKAGICYFPRVLYRCLKLSSGF